VDGLGVFPQTNAGIVAEQPHHGRRKLPPDHLGHGGILVDLGHLDVRRRGGAWTERSHELRDIVEGAGAGLPQPVDQSLREVVLGLRVELDLQLPEPARHAASVHHRDLIVGHHGQPPARVVTDLDASANGVQPGHGRQLLPTDVGAEKVGGGRRQLPRVVTFEVHLGPDELRSVGG
jgi:hypothetical protein